MALLTEQQGDEVWAAWMTVNADEFSVDKNILRADIDNTDQWLDDNKVSFNQDLSAEGQAGYDNSQKSQLLTLVVAKRFQEGTS